MTSDEPPPSARGSRRNSPKEASAARIYDYLVGGDGYYDIDAQVADQLLEDFPLVGWLARNNRYWVQRAVRYLVGVKGIDQILDIGSGIPGKGNVHEIAQAINPECRVAYFDYERDAVEMGQERLAVNPHAEAFLADVRDPEVLLGHLAPGDLIDFKRPVGALFSAVWHFVPESDKPAELMAQYRSRLVSGSYIGLSHATDEKLPLEFQEQFGRFIGHYNQNVSESITLRTIAQVVDLMAGTELTEGGVWPVTDWRPGEPAFVPEDNEEHFTRWALYAAVGRVL